MLATNNQRLIIFDWLNPSNDWLICQNISAKNKITGFLQPLVLSINDSQRLPFFVLNVFSVHKVHILGNAVHFVFKFCSKRPNGNEVQAVACVATNSKYHK